MNAVNTVISFKGDLKALLEEEYGDMPELEDFGMGGDGSPDGEGESSSRRLLRRLRGPVRDPELYELRDYL